MFNTKWLQSHPLHKIGTHNSSNKNYTVTETHKTQLSNQSPLLKVSNWKIVSSFSALLSFNDVPKCSLTIQCSFWLVCFYDKTEGKDCTSAPLLKHPKGLKKAKICDLQSIFALCTMCTLTSNDMIPIYCYFACTDDSKECDIVVVNWNILLLSSQLNSFPSCCLMLGANYLKSVVNFCPWKKKTWSNVIS